MNKQIEWQEVVFSVVGFILIAQFLIGHGWYSLLGYPLGLYMIGVNFTPVLNKFKK